MAAPNVVFDVCNISHAGQGIDQAARVAVLDAEGKVTETFGVFIDSTNLTINGVSHLAVIPYRYQGPNRVTWIAGLVGDMGQYLQATSHAGFAVTHTVTQAAFDTGRNGFPCAKAAPAAAGSFVISLQGGAYTVGDAATMHPGVTVILTQAQLLAQQTAKSNALKPNAALNGFIAISDPPAVLIALMLNLNNHVSVEQALKNVPQKECRAANLDWEDGDAWMTKLPYMELQLMTMTSSFCIVANFLMVTGYNYHDLFKANQGRPSISLDMFGTTAGMAERNAPGPAVGHLYRVVNAFMTMLNTSSDLDFFATSEVTVFFRELFLTLGALDALKSRVAVADEHVEAGVLMNTKGMPLQVIRSQLGTLDEALLNLWEHVLGGLWKNSPNAKARADAITERAGPLHLTSGIVQETFKGGEAAKYHLQWVGRIGTRINTAINFKIAPGHRDRRYLCNLATNLPVVCTRCKRTRDVTDRNKAEPTTDDLRLTYLVDYEGMEVQELETSPVVKVRDAVMLTLSKVKSDRIKAVLPNLKGK